MGGRKWGWRDAGKGVDRNGCWGGELQGEEKKMQEKMGRRNGLPTRNASRGKERRGGRRARMEREGGQKKIGGAPCLGNRGKEIKKRKEKMMKSADWRALDMGVWRVGQGRQGEEKEKERGERREERENK